MQASSPAVSCESQSAPVRRWTVESSRAHTKCPDGFDFPAPDRASRAFRPKRHSTLDLLSVKTGGCSESCSYCSHRPRYDTETGRERLMPVDEVVAAAKAAKDKGASRFCMGLPERPEGQRSRPCARDGAR